MAGTRLLKASTYPPPASHSHASLAAPSSPSRPLTAPSTPRSHGPVLTRTFSSTYPPSLAGVPFSDLLDTPSPSSLGHHNRPSTAPRGYGYGYSPTKPTGTMKSGSTIAVADAHHDDNNVLETPPGLVFTAHSTPSSLASLSSSLSSRSSRSGIAYILKTPSPSATPLITTPKSRSAAKRSGRLFLAALDDHIDTEELHIKAPVPVREAATETTLASAPAAISVFTSPATPELNKVDNEALLTPATTPSPCSQPVSPSSPSGATSPSKGYFAIKRKPAPRLTPQEEQELSTTKSSRREMEFDADKWSKSFAAFNLVPAPPSALMQAAVPAIRIPEHKKSANIKADTRPALLPPVELEFTKGPKNVSTNERLSAAETFTASRIPIPANKPGKARPRMSSPIVWYASPEVGTNAAEDTLETVNDTSTRANETLATPNTSRRIRIPTDVAEDCGCSRADWEAEEDDELSARKDDTLDSISMLSNRQSSAESPSATYHHLSRYGWLSGSKKAVGASKGAATTSTPTFEVDLDLENGSFVTAAETPETPSIGSDSPPSEKVANERGSKTLKPLGNTLLKLSRSLESLRSLSRASTPTPTPTVSSTVGRDSVCTEDAGPLSVCFSGSRYSAASAFTTKTSISTDGIYHGFVLRSDLGRKISLNASLEGMPGQSQVFVPPAQWRSSPRDSRYPLQVRRRSLSDAYYTPTHLLQPDMPLDMHQTFAVDPLGLGIQQQRFGSSAPQLTRRRSSLSVLKADLVAMRRERQRAREEAALIKAERKLLAKKHMLAYAYRRPSEAALLSAAECTVVSSAGQKIQFKDLYQGARTVVCFIRHWWCPSCQDYMSSLMKVDPEQLRSVNLQLIIVGCGSWKMIDGYSKSLGGCPFPIYSDPSRELYTHLGMTVHTLDPGPQPDYVKYGMTANTFVSMKRNVQMPLRNPGELSGLGGEFVLGPGKAECSYAHRMKNTRDHAELVDILKAIGIAVPDQLLKGGQQHVCRTNVGYKQASAGDRVIELVA